MRILLRTLICGGIFLAASGLRTTEVMPTRVPALSLFSPTAHADQPETDLVRLPGQGEIRVEHSRFSRKDRLAPGGGLLVSFDGDGDGALSQAEFETGLTAAFASADGNGDGRLTVFEQRDWAERLPTRDDSLANPVRFDPNLDRLVSYGEFSDVIRNLASPYWDETQAALELSKLKRTGREQVESETAEPPRRTDTSGRQDRRERDRDGRDERERAPRGR